MQDELQEMSEQHFATTATPEAERISLLAPLARDPLLVFVLVFVAGAFLLSSELFSGLLVHYVGSFIVVVPLLTVFILIGRAIALSPAAPFDAFLNMIFSIPVRLYATTVFAALFVTSFTTFKVSIPHFVPFYADPIFASLDVWIHGTDPWRLARSMPPVTSLVVDFFYSQAWFAAMMICGIYAALAAPTAEFRRYMMATVLVYAVLGVLAATALSSVGPVFYDRFYPTARFGDLIATLNADPHAGLQRSYVAYLYDAFTSRNVALGSGISAMPSIHVGIAVLIAWYATSQGRQWAVAGWTFALIILFGSIYTGWHYAVDGYLAAIATTAIWFAVSKVYRLPLAK